MAVMGFPLLVRTARTGFEQVRPRYEQLAATLGAGPARIFFTITLPLAARPVLAGALLGFSRAIGEFGATILVAGSIPGRTRTLALAIFSETEVGHDAQAGCCWPCRWPSRSPPCRCPTRSCIGRRTRRARSRPCPLAITLDFSLRQGDFTLDVHQQLASDALALVGPSGAGKTSLLESIAGLRTPTSGNIAIGGRTLFSTARQIDVPARLRHVGYVPQDALLFPHMNVRRNILYGAERRLSGAESRGRLPLARVLDVLEIAPLVERRVDRLSGGERQRVALARALMASPALLLLDEPLAALDPSLRWRIVPYLQRIRDELGLPMIVASHDVELVRAVADSVMELAGGQVASAGPAAPARAE